MYIHDIKTKFKRLFNRKVTVILIVVGAVGTVLKCLEMRLGRMKIR